MDVITAHGLLASLPDADLAELLPPDLTVQNMSGLDGITIAPLLAAACCSLSGMLPDCKDTDGLREAAAHFRSLWDAEVIDPEQVTTEAASVFQQLEEAMLAHAAQVGNGIGRNASFSPAELN